jgi:hypothetical protein
VGIALPPLFCCIVDSFHSETALFRRGGVNLRSCICGVFDVLLSAERDFPRYREKIPVSLYEDTTVSIRGSRIDKR